MPKFKKFIQQSPEDYGEALKVSGFHVSNEPQENPRQEPFPYNGNLALFTGGSGIDPSIRVSSGQFYSAEPLVEWYLVNPSNDNVYTNEEIYDLTVFSGFQVLLKNETGGLVNALATGDSKQSKIQLSSELILNSFANIGDSGALDVNEYVNPRRFRVDVVATDYYGRTNTGIYFLNCPSPDVTGCKVGLGKYISLDLKSTKNSGLRNLDIYSSPTENFKIDTQSGFAESIYNYSYDLDLLGNEYISNAAIAPPVDSGYFYAAVLRDSFGTGEAYYYPSSIKPYTIDPLLFNVEASGFDGKVIATRDTFNKNVTTQVIGKLSKDLSASRKTYEVKVIESGSLFDKSDFFQITNPQVKGIETFVHGT